MHSELYELLGMFIFYGTGMWAFLFLISNIALSSVKRAGLFADLARFIYARRAKKGWVKDGGVEPVFVLRAQDLTAPYAISRWLESNTERLGYSHPKIKAATEIRDAMLEWPNRKLPD